ncbi:hypothetical protein [Synechocystis sp. PCC 7509]|uniref:hypothetical protein n=1 Tax=Synechocystis sp. PCC 7509 TaxID=927677 RepID=UPI0002ABEBA7|nr:hypothetical protein [Synechocystis sp. PCC 7509]
MPKLTEKQMDSENNQHYQKTVGLVDLAAKGICVASSLGASEMTNSSEEKNAPEIVKMLHSGQLLEVNSRRRNGLILYKGFHAEFAGPGAAVGNIYDFDCKLALPVGNLSLLSPNSHEDRQKAYLIRRQWIRLMKQITEKPIPQQRVQKILEQFEQYFDAETVAQLPDEAFALLVGVLPQTVSAVRRSYRSFNR